MDVHGRVVLKTMMNEMIYLELLKAMEDKGIRYVVVGGVAVVLHGFVRATMDLDLVVSLESSNALKFLELVKGLGYRPKMPVPLEQFADSQANGRNG